MVGWLVCLLVSCLVDWLVSEGSQSVCEVSYFIVIKLATRRQTCKDYIFLFYFAFPVDVASDLFIPVCSLSFTRLLSSDFQACLFYVFQLGNLSVSKSSLMFRELSSVLRKYDTSFDGYLAMKSKLLSSDTAY